MPASSSAPFLSARTCQSRRGAIELDDVLERVELAVVDIGRAVAPVKSVFGRPRRLATRAAAQQFMATHYRRFSGQKICPAPLPTVPHDYDQQLRTLRRRLRITQHGLARRIGAAGKAVIYQWESRKRTPSPVLWQQVLRLQLVNARPGRTRGGGIERIARLGERAVAGRRRQPHRGRPVARYVCYSQKT